MASTVPWAKGPEHLPNWEGVGNSRGEAEKIARNTEKAEGGVPGGRWEWAEKHPDYSQNGKNSGSTSQ